MPNSSFTCPICNEPIEGSHTSCPRCGFKFVGATQTFNPVVTEVDGQVCEAESATPELEVLSGPYAGESFTLGNGTFTVGRDPKCDIFLSNMTVSRHNSTIVIDGANAKIIDAGSTTLELVRALEGEALQANYVTNGVAHARTLAQKGCRVFLPGGLLRPQTEAIVGAAAVSSLQQYNFTKAFIGANGVALEAGFTTPDPEEAAVKATVVHRARESWFLVDDAKFARICPAVIADLHSGAILTNRCPDPKYKQYTLVKETEL